MNQKENNARRAGDTKEISIDALYAEMLRNVDYTLEGRGELNRNCLSATYYPTDRNAPMAERETIGGAYVEIHVDDDCREAHLSCEASYATPLMLQAAAEFLEEYPLDYWEDLAREEWEKGKQEARDEREWKGGMMRDYYDELRSCWR